MDLKLKIDVDALPPLQKNLLLVLPPLLIIGICVFLLIMPTLEERGQILANIEKQDGDIATLRKNSSKLATLIAENRKLGDRLAALQMQLPEEKEVSELLRQVSELGVKSGMQIVSWKPGSRSVHSSKEVYEIPVDVSMRGTYHTYGQFLGNIMKLDRIVNITNINMKTGSQKFRKDQTGLDIGFTGLTYSLIPEKERKAMQKDEKKK